MIVYIHQPQSEAYQEAAAATGWQEARLQSGADYKLGRPVSSLFPGLWGSFSLYHLALHSISTLIFLFFRASDDPEKTNTTYLDDSQQAQGEMWTPFIGVLHPYCERLGNRVARLHCYGNSFPPL